MNIQAVIQALGISKDEVVERAAQMLANEMTSQEKVGEVAWKIISERIETIMKTQVPQQIDEKLSAELEAIISTEYVPVDMWGVPMGEPTTIRERLNQQARRFWDQKVDKEGKPCEGYYEKPRHEWLFAKIVGEEFHKTIAQHYTDIVAVIKDALKDDAKKQIDEHIERIIQVRRAR